MFVNKKTKLKQKLQESWGKLKDADFQFDKIEHYFRKKEKTSTFQVISDQTINDIDFKKLFAYIDRTCSRIGQQYLFNKLLTLEHKPDFTEQEFFIRHFIENIECRHRTQIILSMLNDVNAYNVSRLFLDDFIGKPKNFSIIKALSVIGISTLFITFIIPKFIILLTVVFCVNLVVHYRNKKHAYMYSDSIPQLSILCKGINELAKIGIFAEHMDKTITSLKSVMQLKNQMKLFTLEAKSHNPVEGFIYVMLEYLKIQCLIEPIIVFNVLKRLNEKKQEIQDLYEFYGKVDCAISVASLRCGQKYYCRPKLSENQKGLNFTDVYHPLVPNCIPNSMTVRDKSILLTGSNMSGKTTFIRSVSINTLFAQTINTCFASDFQLSPMKIFSAIRISDDVLSGKSYYFEEVLTINKMVVESQCKVTTLFLLDEIFKGTNTIERIAAGKAVLSYLCKTENIVFVSTHDIELTGLLKEEYDLFHFTEVIENNQIHFDYKLKNGELKTRNAIRILEINGYPKDLITEAKEISNKIIENISKQSR
jgi:hypothetical protein